MRYGEGTHQRKSLLHGMDELPDSSHEELEQALYWVGRIKRGEDLHLADLCISTVQRHVQTLVNHVQAVDSPPIYHGLCPGCGRAVELKRNAE
jgi:hypothetical protein